MYDLKSVGKFKCSLRHKNYKLKSPVNMRITLVWRQNKQLIINSNQNANCYCTCASLAALSSFVRSACLHGGSSSPSRTDGNTTEDSRLLMGLHVCSILL